MVISLTNHRQTHSIPPTPSIMYDWYEYCLEAYDTIRHTAYFGVYMLTLPTDPAFLDSTIHFVQSFVPSLIIHRVHIQDRTESKLMVQLEMTDGSLLCLHAQYWTDRIHLVLEYGWQHIELWMFANFTSHVEDRPTSDVASKLQSFQPQTTVEESLRETVLDDIHHEMEDFSEYNSLNKTTVNRIFSENIDKELLEFRGESRLCDSTFGDLLGDLNLSGMQRTKTLTSTPTNVGKKRLFMFDRDIGKDLTVEQHPLPKTHPAFQQAIVRPRTVDGQFEQSF